MLPAVLITRPEPSALIFADQVRTRLGCGVPIVVSPLMRIEVCGALPDLAGVTRLIFTSQNGVLAYAGMTARRDIPCYAVGDATARAAAQQGMTAISASGDATDLLQLIQNEAPMGRLLHLHGEHVTTKLAGQLQMAGFDAQGTVIYRQIAQALSAEAQMLLAQSVPVIVLHFSPRSARLFHDSGPYEAPILAVAISANTADAIPAGSTLRSVTASLPTSVAMLDAVAQQIASLDHLEGG